MVKELQMLPEALLQQHSVRQVKDMYLKTFEELSEFHPEGRSNEKELNRYCVESSANPHSPSPSSAGHFVSQ